MNQTQASLSRNEIRKILRRHKGAARGISLDLGISHTTVSLWLRGKTTSQRIAEAAHAKALELLDKERAAENAA